MLRVLCSAVVGAVLSGFAFLLVTGRYINDGPVLFRFSPSPGVHPGDPFIIAGWVAAMLSLAGIVLTSGRSAR